MKTICRHAYSKFLSAIFCQSIDFCCRFLPSEKISPADFWQLAPNTLILLTNKVCNAESSPKTAQAIVIKGQTAAAGGNGNCCGLCMPFFRARPLIRALWGKTVISGTHALGPRHGEDRPLWAASGMPIIILRAAAISSGLLFSTPVFAEGWSRMGNGNWSSSDRPSMRMTARADVEAHGEGWTTLNRFEVRRAPSVAKAPEVALTPPPMGSGIAGLRHLIRYAESREKGYDAIHHSAKRLPIKRPTDMTMGEILAWIEATPGQHHAIGQYQIIPATLKRLMIKTGLPVTVKFTPKIQDRLADVLILEAGYRAFTSGQMSASDFMDELAKVWAGFPMANGRSAYHGKASNRATISRASFKTHMSQIFAIKTIVGKAG